MPYIKQKERNLYNNLASQIVEHLDDPDIDFNTGHVNYIVYSIMKEWFYRRAGYRTINDVAGVLNNVAAEFYRKIAVPYEDEKCKQNGEVDRLKG
jgi:hypothetical protein